MKPFNLEEAKNGKPVCTRCGNNVEIIDFNYYKNRFKNIFGRVIYKNINRTALHTWNDAGFWWNDEYIKINLDLFMKND